MTSVDKARARIQEWRRDPVKFSVDCFGIQPDPWQIDAMRELGGDYNPARRLCLKACTGPGKAQPVGMMIETPDGLRRWGDIAPGDVVFALDGTPTRVVAQTWRGTLPLYRVIFDDGTSTDCCADHLWRTRGRTERRHIKQRSGAGWTEHSERLSVSQGHYRTPEDGWSTLSLSEIMARNDSNDGRTRRQFEIPQQGAIEYPEAVLACDPYVLGAWLGDGCRSKRGARVSWQDEGIDDEVVRRGYRVTRHEGGRSATVHGLSSELRADGLNNIGSHDRRVPPQYMRASIRQRKDILAGLLDTDGTIATDRSIAFDVTSNGLVEDVAWLVRSLGGKAMAIRKKRGRYRDQSGEVIECRMVYRVTLSLPFCPFLLKRKADRWVYPQIRYMTRWIERIEAIEPGEAMCIQVDHPLACYLANDFIVTHNSSALAWMGWHRLACFAAKGEHPKGAALSITADNLKDNLWAEMSKWQQRSPFLSSAFTWTKEKIYANEHPETWFLSARSFAKDANAEAIGRALSGLHSQFPFILLDETGDMPSAVGRAAAQIFTGNPRDAAIIQAGNPTSTSGLLYESCTRAGESWSIITVTADPDDPKRTPRVSIEHAREMISTYGRDNPWVMATILGLFPPTGFNALLGPDDVDAAIARAYRADEIANAPVVLGGDVARQGDDSSAVAKRQGRQAFPIHMLRIPDTMLLAEQFILDLNKHQADAFFVDETGGYGAGVIDAMRQLGHDVIGVQFGGKASDYRYFNKRSEMYMEMAKWVKAGGALPDDRELKEELCATTFIYQGDKFRIVDKGLIKDKLGRSPDKADALALTFAFPAAKKDPMTAMRSKQSRQDYDPFAKAR